MKIGAEYRQAFKGPYYYFRYTAGPPEEQRPTNYDVWGHIDASPLFCLYDHEWRGIMKPLGRIN